MSTPIEPLAYTVEEAAEACRVSTDTIFRLIARGELRKAKLGRRTLIPRADLEAMLERHVEAA
jgi:excisionase family DNA binding protein